VYPQLFEIPLINKGVPAYGTMLMVGFLLAVFLTRRRHKSLGLIPSEVFDLGFVLVIGGILGARLLHVVVYWPDYFQSTKYWPDWMGSVGWLGAIVATWNGGLVYYGGLGGGVLGLFLYGRYKKIPLTDLLDFAAPGGAIGLAMTRVGCFLNGCCFGKPSEVPWAVTFPPNSHMYQLHDADGRFVRMLEPFAVHPAQLYETLAALGIFAVLWWLYPRRRFAGQISWTFGMLYTAWRFCNEFFRADSGPDYRYGPLTIFQYMSIPLFMIFLGAYLFSRHRGRQPYAPPDKEESS
jgi:phosphatidylglycerol---prolipoprotein diacylglyceryl transferase